MTESATTDDLDWWLDLAPTLKWTWARTYAATAPHWWVTGRTSGLDLDDFIRAGRVIRTFGEPGRFWSYTNVYLFTRDRRLKFWVMWGSPPVDLDARLINVANADQVYGPQTNFDETRLAELRLES